MLFRRKKNKRISEVSENRDSLFNLVAKAKVLTSMAEESDVIELLNKVLDDLRYSSPSAKEEVSKIDNKIDKMLDDIKIMLSNKKSNDKIIGEISDTILIIAKRKSLTEV